MSRSFDRALARVAAVINPKREPEPDFTGWSDVEIITWKLNNGATLQDMVREAMSHERPTEMADETEREQLVADSLLAKPETAPEAMPEPNGAPLRRIR